MQVGDRPQQREFRKEILQAMQVGVWGLTQKLTKSQLTIMCKLGIGPEQREMDSQFLQTMQVGEAPTQKL